MELRKKGMPIKVIARKLGVSEWTVREACMAAGYPESPSRSAQPESNGTDWWPMVPQYIRLTERGRSQRVPRGI